MKVVNFVEEFKSRKIKNTQVAPNAIGDYINKALEIKAYLPFLTKKEIVNMVVAASVKEVDGVKKVDSISQYVSFVVAAITAHTNLEFSAENVYADYDLLSESGLLPHLLAEFKESYDELGVLLKMAVSDELDDNNLNIIIGKFLNSILGKMDGVVDTVKGFADKADLSNILGADINKEDVAKLIGFLDKLK